MPDYVSILKRSIAARNASAPADRRQVFDKARGALARQLAGIEPPLSDLEIEAEHQKLEDAIDDVEAEYAFEDELLPSNDADDRPPAPEPAPERVPPIATAAPALEPGEVPAARRGMAALEPAAASPPQRAAAAADDGYDEPSEPASISR